MTGLLQSGCTVWSHHQAQLRRCSELTTLRRYQRKTFTNVRLDGQQAKSSEYRNGPLLGTARSTLQPGNWIRTKVIPSSFGGSDLHQATTSDTNKAAPAARPSPEEDLESQQPVKGAPVDTSDDASSHGGPMAAESPSPYKDRKALDREIMSIGLPMLATLAADPIAGLVDSAYMGRAGSTQLAAVGVALSVFNTATKLFNVPLLAVTTSSVAKATGEASRVAGTAATAPASATTPSSTAPNTAAAGPGPTGNVRAAAAAPGGVKVVVVPSSSPSQPVAGAAAGTAAAEATRRRDDCCASALPSSAAADAWSAPGPPWTDAPGNSHAKGAVDVGVAASAAEPSREASGGPKGCTAMRGAAAAPMPTDDAATSAAPAPPAAAAAAPTQAVAFEVSYDTARNAAAPPAAAAAVAGAASLQARAASACFWLSTLVGMVQAAVLLGGGASLVRLWGVPAGSPVYDPALGFLLIRGVGAPITLLMLTFQGIYRGLQDTRTPFVATLLANGINIALAPIFIFACHLGAPGAAAATVAAQAVPLVLMLRNLDRAMPLFGRSSRDGGSGGCRADAAASAATTAAAAEASLDRFDPHSSNSTSTSPSISSSSSRGCGSETKATAVAAHRDGGRCDGPEHGVDEHGVNETTPLWAKAEASGRHRGPGVGRGPGRGLRPVLSAMADVLPLFKPTGFLVLRSASVTATYAVATTLVARAGAAVTASHQICFQIWLACSLLADALAVAAQSLMARDLGAGSTRGARQVAARVSSLSLGMGLLLAVLLAAGGRVLPGLFSSDPEVLRLVTGLFPIIAATQPITVLAMAWDGILYGVGGFRYAAISMAIAALPAIVVMQQGTAILHHFTGTATAAAASNGVLGAAAAASPEPIMAVTAASAAAAAAAASPEAPGQLSGEEQLWIVWAGLAVLMLLRWLTIAVPYGLRMGPFRKLRGEGAHLREAKEGS